MTSLLKAMRAISFMLFLYFIPFLLSSSIAQDCTLNDVFAQDGSAYYHNFGKAVAANNDQVIVGAPYDTGASGASGSAYIYDWDGTNWIETELPSTLAVDGQKFGWSADITTDAVIVGAPRITFYTTPSTDPGAAYIFMWDGAQWLEHELLASDGLGGDGFGYDVAILGTRAVVGAPFADPSGNVSGAIYIFEYNGTAWLETEKIIASDGLTGDQFGHSIGITTDRFVVGAFEDDESSLTDTGSAYVFDWDGTQWNESKIIASDPGGSDLFGDDVDVVGDRIAVGASETSGVSGSGGAVYIFEFDGTVWTETEKLFPSVAGGAFPYFGRSVDLAVDRLAVGENWKFHSSLSYAGKAFLYDYDGTDWTETEFVASDAADQQFFGTSVAISNDLFIAGAIGDETIVDLAGAAYMFVDDGTNWTEYKNVPADYGTVTGFGKSVDIKGDKFVVGANQRLLTGLTFGAGTAFLYEYNGSSWMSQEFIPTNGDFADNYGKAVSVDGDRFVVGAPYDDDQGNGAGAVYIYDYDGVNWVESKLFGSDITAGYAFGWDLSLSGDTLIVGTLSPVNAAYIFIWDGASWQESILTPSDGMANDNFGFSVDILDDRAIVGAYAVDNQASNDGAAYIFDFDGTNWNETIKLHPTNANNAGNFGLDVAITNDEVMIGGSNFSNKVWFFEYDGTTWNETELLVTLISTAPVVAIDGDKAMLGDDTSGSTGQVYTFQKQGSCWNQIDIVSPTSTHDIGSPKFGHAVAIDGDQFLVSNFGLSDNVELFDCPGENFDPIAVCQDISVSLDANGNLTIFAADIDAGSAAACGSVNLSLDNDAFDCTDLGTNTVVLTATDSSGNTATCSAIVTIEDTTIPIVVAQDITVTPDMNGDVFITVADVMISVTDNCDQSLNPYLAEDTFSCQNAAFFSTFLIAEDASGNFGFDQFTVTIDDTTPPNVICKDHTIYLNELGEASLSPLDVIEKDTQDLTGFLPLEGALCPTGGDIYLPAFNNIYINGSDSNMDCWGGDGFNDCTELSHIFQTTLPNDGEVCFEYYPLDIGAGEIFGYSIGVDWNTTPATLENLQAFTVPLFDPSMTVPNDYEKVCLYGTEGQQFSFIVYSDFWNNGIVETSFSGELIDGTDPSADRNAMNSCTPSQNSGDGVQPVIGLISYDEYSLSLSCDTEYRIQATSAWGDAQLYLYDQPFDPLDICANLVAWDGDSGNGFEPIVNFINDPTQTYYLDVSAYGLGQVGTYDVDIVAGSLGAGFLSIDILNMTIAETLVTDNCNVVDYSLSQVDFDCSHIGTQTVDLTVQNNSGLQTSCTVNVTVLDTLPPKSNCMDITIELDQNGEAQITNLDLYDPMAQDLTGFLPFWAATCANTNTYDPGLNYMQLLASDHASFGGSGQNTCTFFGTIRQVPVNFNGEICFDWETSNAGIGDLFSYSTNVDWGVVTASIDALNANSTVLATSSNPGSGQTQTCVPVQTGDVFALIVYSNYFVNGNSFGFGPLTIDINNIVSTSGAIENCDYTYTLSQENFDCFDIGTVVVNLTQTDDSGNSSSCTSNVTVEDNIPPTPVVQDITVAVDANGEVSVDASFFNAGSFDNCQLDLIDIDITDFDCDDIDGIPDAPFGYNEVGSFDPSLSFVNRLAIHDDLIYATQRPLDVVNVFDLTGTLLNTFGSGHFGEPDGIAFDSGDNIYVSDRFNAKIVKFDSDGNWLSEFFTPSVEDIVIHNDIIYAAHDGLGKVTSYDLSGNVIQDLFTFAGAHGLGFYNNQLYVCNNSSNSTAGIYDLSGNNILTFDVGGWAFDIIGGDCGNIYVANTNDLVTAIFDNTGSPITSISENHISNAFYNGQYYACSVAGEFFIYDITCPEVGGYNPVVFTTTDVSGNTATADVRVTVIDQLPPVAVCKDITITVPADGTPVTIDAIDLDGGSTDNCALDPAGYSLDINTFDITDKGDNPVMLTVTDEAGYAVMCSATVTVFCECDPNVSSLIPNTAAGLHPAAYKDDDGQFTHYCDALGRVLLSIDSPSAASIPASEVSINITPGGFYYEQYCTGSGGSEDGSCFISNEDGSVVLCRTWDVDNAINNAFIRFYFDQGDVDIVNDLLVSLGFDPMTDPSQMWFYKVLNDLGHQKPEDLATADVQIIDNDGTGNPTEFNWSLGMTDVSYYAEYQVESFSGGGGGGAQNGGSPICDAFTASISGDEILSAGGTGDVFVNIVGGVPPYAVLLSDGTIDNSYQSGDPLSVSFTQTTSYTIAGIYDAVGCPSSFNTGMATKYVSTGDVTPPTAICQDITVDLSSYGTASISVSDIDNGSNDNEGIATITIDQTQLDCDSPSMVTLTVTDISGNSDQCTANIIINDPLNACCPTTKTIPYTPTDSKEYQADQLINSDALIKLGSGGTDIIMHAGTQICLEPGFEVEIGAQFEAYIGPCN